MTKRGLLVSALVWVLALTSGCMASKETRDGAKELDDRLGTPSWASSVRVKTGLNGQFEDFVQITVTAKKSADPSDLTGFVVALPEQAAQAGLGESAGYGLDFVWPSGARLSMDWEPQVVADEVLRGMTEWSLIATANIDLDRHTSATLRSDGGASYVFDLGASERESVFLVWSTFGLFMQPDTSVQVTGTIGAVAADFATASAPTKAQVDLWTHLLDAFDKLPADLPATLLSLHFLDRTVADVSLLAPDDTTDETLTVEAYGDRLWPVVRPQLAAMAALPEAWSYFASWHPSYAELQHNIFISLLSDQPPTDNGDESTRWSRAAKEYVGSL